MVNIREMNKEEIYKTYKTFIEDFVLHFPENERQKVRELLEFLVNSRSRALENSDIEDLFYVFSETALENGNFSYKEFSSWKEIENWQPQGKIVEAYLVLSYSEDSFMTDIAAVQEIYNSLLRHFSSPDKAYTMFFRIEQSPQSCNMPCKVNFFRLVCCNVILHFLNCFYFWCHFVYHGFSIIAENKANSTFFAKKFII